MKIVVYPNELVVGGSPLNAVQFAGALRDRGHDVWVFARPGPLTPLVHELGLTSITAPAFRRRPSRDIIRGLRDLCRSERIDVVHAYEWPAAIEAFYGPHLVDGVAVVCTVLAMAAAPFLPRTMPLVVGTEQIADGVRRARRGSGEVVHVLEPPVDTRFDQPLFDDAGFAARMGIGNRPLVVIVSRLAHELKLEGIELAIHATQLLDERFGARLLIVGDGPARPRIEALAAHVNRSVGRESVTLTGELLDPRPAYAAADVVLGMGSSVLRAMAFAKPVIVLGEDAFAAVLDSDSAPQFLWQGFYGLGDGDPRAERLAELIAELLADPDRRGELGRFSRELVARFDLVTGAERLERIYVDAIMGSPRGRGWMKDVLASSIGIAGYKVRRRRRARRGERPIDEMNDKALLRMQMAPQPGPFVPEGDV